METRRFACVGIICNPPFDAVFDPDGYINICIAYLKNNTWIIPNDWMVIDDKVYCPRCLVHLICK